MNFNVWSKGDKLFLMAIVYWYLSYFPKIDIFIYLKVIYYLEKSLHFFWVSKRKKDK